MRIRVNPMAFAAAYALIMPLVLAIIALWEPLSEKASGLSLDQIVAISASMGTLFTAAATFLTVREIARQRLAAYHPELTLEKILISGKMRRPEGGGLPEDWSHRRYHGVGKYEEAPFLGVPLRNVGQGTAKELRLHWSMPIEGLVETANNITRSIPLAESLKYEHGMLSADSEECGRWTSMWRNQRDLEVDYILPLADEKEPVFIDLPHAFRMICSFIIAFAYRSEEFEWPELTIRLNIAYRDMQSNEFTVNFDVNLLLNVAHRDMFGGMIAYSRVSNDS